MARRRAPLLALVLALAGLAALAPGAVATFHLMQIREVYPGSAAKPGSEYVELQMWAPGQELVGGHPLRAYGPSGAVTATSSFPSDLARGADQSTMILTTPEAEAEFGFSGDGPLALPAQLDSAGGAVCWESIDCVSWGSFSGALPSPAGSPAPAPPDGMALRRSIAPGCATLLEPTDDHDNSAADFAPVFPGPRPNSVAPSERPCAGAPGAPGGAAGGGGGAQPGSGRGAPETTLGREPARRSGDRTPTFSFAADETGASFECRLDGGKFKRCRSPFTSKPLALGHHTFRVRARDESGLADPSPALFGFQVQPRR